MIGAIVGDIVGSRFEFVNHKGRDFALFVECKALGEVSEETLKSTIDSSSFTDDSVMTLAIADAILRLRELDEASYDTLSKLAIQSMRKFGNMYPLAGYGGTFDIWLQSEEMGPYNSWGNGSAMRVSACGWAGRTLDEVKAMSRAVTEVTHNHPEGIKGARRQRSQRFLQGQGSRWKRSRRLSSATTIHSDSLSTRSVLHTSSTSRARGPFRRRGRRSSSRLPSRMPYAMQSPSAETRTPLVLSAERWPVPTTESQPISATRRRVSSIRIFSKRSMRSSRSSPCKISL